jgi:NAD(P)-dependent dehydrogenase (short-subunit alcohol dehydrogenase family)
MGDVATRPDVVVITGAGGMGRAIARRLGSGCSVVFADSNEAQLERATDELGRDGYTVQGVRTDVSARDDVAALARAAADLGVLRCLVHTAGVSPVQARPEKIIAVDVIGTARVLDEFEPYVEPGTVAVCIASMAGSMTDLPRELLARLATTPTDELHTLAELNPASMEAASAYGLAKRANQVRVEAASVTWGRRGGRVVSISPGVIATEMGQAELSGPFGDIMRSMIEMSACRRLGTADDIAATVEFLASRAASFITGIDVRVDGGVVAAIRSTPDW